MKIYIVYQKFYNNWENGKKDLVNIESGYKNKRKAIKKAKELMNIAKSSNLYIDENVRNKSNPFKRDNVIDFYKENQEKKVTTIVIEEIKLIA